MPGVKRHPSTMPLPGESLCSRGCPEITGARVGSPVIVSGVTPPLTETMPGSDCPMLPTLNEPPLNRIVGGEPLIMPPCVPDLASAGLPFINRALAGLVRGAISDGNTECPGLVGLGSLSRCNTEHTYLYSAGATSLMPGVTAPKPEGRGAVPCGIPGLTPVRAGFNSLILCLS